GVSLYVLAWATVGFLGSDFLGALMRGFHTAGRAVELLVAIAVVVYIAYRVVLYWKQRTFRVVPRVQVAEIMRKMAERPDRVAILDVRSHGYYDSGAMRIKGSIRLEPNGIPGNLRDLSPEHEIYVYCT
ncbi:MAG: sulfurtransferase, partial [Acidobacteriaceae bacterium]|nr:sulfurtransferase [Acidobacteriaceae bacterium]